MHAREPAPQRRPRRPDVRLPPPPAPTPTPTPTATPSATTAGQPAASSPFQPTPSLSSVNSAQIEASQSKSLGGLLFTTPGATSAGLAPGTQRPVLRGLDDFRVRVQENGIGSMDVSDYGQDHGVPIDPLSTQKVEIFRGPEALRYGSQAVGGVVEATNNRIPFAAPPGGWQTQLQGATTTVDRGARRRRHVRRRHPRLRLPFRFLRAPQQRLFRPELSLSVSDRPRATVQRETAELVVPLPRARRPAARTSSTAAISAPPSPTSPRSTTSRPWTARRPTRASTCSRPKSPAKASFGRSPPPSTWSASGLGAVEYHHDEIGLGEDGIDGVQATFNNHAQEAKTEVEFMPITTALGTLISSIGTQFDHQQIDTLGDAGSLLGSARTNRGAAYFFNEFWLTGTLRTLLAGRIETVRLDGTAGLFPAALVPPPDNPTLALQSLGFNPASIAFSMIKDLPSWMVASATVQRIERAPTALELFAHGAHDAPGTFEIGDPTLKIETANTAELGLKRTAGAFRFDGKVYYTKYDNFIFRQATGILCGATFATCGRGHRVHSDDLRPARRHLPRRRDRLAMGLAAGGDRRVRRRWTIRLRARHLHRRQQRPAHAADARRRRHLLAQRQLVRAHGVASRLRAERPRRQRHADRRLQPAQDGNQQQAVLARLALGSRPSSPPASSATTCSASMCAIPSSSTRTKS